MRAILIAALLALCTPAGAAEICHPLDGASRVLASANPNDIRPEWRGESRIGTDWSFVPEKDLSQDGFDYRYGELHSPRGSDQGPAFILSREWDCNLT